MLQECQDGCWVAFTPGYSHPLPFSLFSPLPHTFSYAFVRYSSYSVFFAFVLDQPFPFDTKVTVRIGPEIPSAEGPCRSPHTRSYAFTTIPKFSVVSTEPRYTSVPVALPFGNRSPLPILSLLSSLPLLFHVRSFSPLLPLYSDAINLIFLTAV